LDVEKEKPNRQAMIKKLILPLLVMAFVAQWLVPAKLIYDSEKTNSAGKIFRFKIRPVDPYDPFRGRYITLSFMDDQAIRDTLEKFSYDESAFVLVGHDSTGTAQIKNISHVPFAEPSYFEATISYLDRDRIDGLQSIRVDFPFNKFFLEETIAPGAETVYRESTNDTIPAYALVSILDGKAVLRDVIIRDSSIADVVRARVREK
jgi:GDYXXLXY protein